MDESRLIRGAFTGPCSYPKPHDDAWMSNKERTLKDIVFDNSSCLSSASSDVSQ